MARIEFSLQPLLRNAWLDSIITGENEVKEGGGGERERILAPLNWSRRVDPPYGFREGIKKIGVPPGKKMKPRSGERIAHILLPSPFLICNFKMLFSAKRPPM